MKILSFIVFFPVCLFASVGDKDRQFGANGELFNYCGQSKVPITAALQSDDKIIIVCQAPSNKDTFDVIRLSQNGGIDSTFGASGKTVIDIAAIDNEAVGAIAIQNDDKIVLAGISNSNPISYFALRLSANGNPDLGFGNSNGISVQTTGWSKVTSMSIGTSGNVFIAGIGSVINSFVGLNGSGAQIVTQGQAGTDAKLLAQGSDKVIFYTGKEFKRYILGGLSNISVDNSFSFSNTLSLDNNYLVEDVSNRFFLNHTRVNNDGSLDRVFSGALPNSAGVSRRENGGLISSGQEVVDSSVIKWKISATDANGELEKSFGGTGFVEQAITINSVLRKMLHQKLGRAMLIGERVGQSYAVAFISPDAKGAVIDQTSVVFPDTEKLTSSSSIAITLSNSSVTSFDISSIMIGGLNNSDYAMTKTCGNALSAGANCIINLTFQPNSVGVKTATLTIITTAPQGTVIVPLSGNATDTTPTTAVASLSVSNINFPDTLIDNGSQWISATLSNTGTGSFTISNAHFNQGENFAVSSVCPATLLPNTSCQIQFQFTPTVAGSFADAFNIPTSAPQGVLAVSLIGNGVPKGIAHASVSNANITFNNIYVGTGSTSTSVLISNEGTSSFSINSLTLNGSSNFSYASNCSDTVAAGTNCQIAVYFTPISSGTFTGTLQITTDAPEGTLSVGVSGTAVTESGTAQAQANVTSISFPNIDVGYESTYVFGILNTGTAPFYVNGYSTATSSFQIEQLFYGGTCSVPLAPGGSCSYKVTFNPQAEGNLSDEVRIETTAPEGTLSVPVSGVGVLSKASIDVSALTFPDTVVKTHSSVKSITVSNTGTNSLIVTEVIGADPSWFVVNNHCIGVNILPGSNCKIDVDFFAFNAEVKTSQLHIATSAPEGTFIVPLSGKGVPAPSSDSGGGGGGGGNGPVSVLVILMLFVSRHYFNANRRQIRVGIV